MKLFKKECLKQHGNEWETHVPWAPDMSEAVDFLHQDVWPCIREPESHQTTTHQHRWCQEDRDDFSNTDQRAKDQVPQHCCELTQSVTEAEAGSSVINKESKALSVWGNGVHTGLHISVIDQQWSKTECTGDALTVCGNYLSLCVPVPYVPPISRI